MKSIEEILYTLRRDYYVKEDISYNDIEYWNILTDYVKSAEKIGVRLEKIYNALEKNKGDNPVLSQIAYDLWHLIKELNYEKSNKQ